MNVVCLFGLVKKGSQKLEEFLSGLVKEVVEGMLSGLVKKADQVVGGLLSGFMKEVVEGMLSGLVKEADQLVEEGFLYGLVMGVVECCLSGAVTKDHLSDPASKAMKHNFNK